MKQMTVFFWGTQWERVPKHVARAAYNRGERVLLNGAGLPVEHRLSNPYVVVNYDDVDMDDKTDIYVMSGNCLDKAGPYPAFYLEAK